MTRHLLVCGWLLLAATAAAVGQAPNEIRSILNLQYGMGGGQPLTLDILRRRDSENTKVPVVVFIRTGSWLSSRKEDMRPAALELARKGFAVCLVRCRPARQAPFPAQLLDCKCAVRWVRAHARQYHLNEEQIGAWGRSSGGHLAALLGTSADVPALESGAWPHLSSRVQAVVDCFGPIDLSRMAEDVIRNRWSNRISPNEPDSPEAILLGGPPAQHVDVARAANPLTYLRKGCPPFLILHGDRDEVVPLRQSELFCQALQDAGVEAQMVVLPGAGHGFDDEHWLVPFFERHLRTPPPPPSAAGPRRSKAFAAAVVVVVGLGLGWGVWRSKR